MTKGKERWEVLLEPDLQGHVVLPNSPRLVMALADRMGNGNELKRLRLQAKTFDDRNALNWVLAGKAKVAVLPLQHCMSSLLRDPRLSVALPAEGAPLNWTMVAQPRNTIESSPDSIVKNTWDASVMGKLLVEGFIPPLPYAQLIKVIDFLPKEHQSILFSSEKTFENLWSLPPVGSLSQRILEKRWVDSTP